MTTSAEPATAADMTSITVARISIESRRGRKDDLERIISALFFVPWQLREFIASIWCDSEYVAYRIVVRDAAASPPGKNPAADDLSVTLRGLSGSDRAQRIADAFENGLRLVSDGHGGIVVQPADRRPGDNVLVTLRGWWWNAP